MLRGGHELIARDVTQLSQTTIASAGAEVKCGTKYLEDRVRNGLEQLLSKIKGRPFEPLVEANICTAIPNHLDLSDKTVEVVTFWGYNLEASGEGALKAYLVFDDSEKRVDLTNTFLNLPSAYQLTLRRDGLPVPMGHVEIFQHKTELHSIAVVNPPTLPIPECQWSGAVGSMNDRAVTSFPAWDFKLACGSGYAVAGVMCIDMHCAAKRLYCCGYKGGSDGKATVRWNNLLSSDPRGPQSQPLIKSTTGFIAGLHCIGDFCNYIQLGILESPHLKNTGQCTTLNYIISGAALTLFAPKASLPPAWDVEKMPVPQ